MCRGALDRRDPTDPFPWPRPAKAVVVFEPPDPVLAGAVVEVLKDLGIKAIAVGYYNPYLGNNLLARSSIAIAHVLHGGRWGRIFVFRSDEERARAIIEEWLRGSPQWPEGGETEPDDGTGNME